MADRQIIDPFHRALYGLLTVDIDNRLMALGSGSAGSFEDYKRQVGYLEALRDVLDRCAVIEREKYGEPSEKATVE